MGPELSTLSEYLIALLLGSSFIIYTLHNVSVLGPCIHINDSGLFAWISMTVFVSKLFYYM